MDKVSVFGLGYVGCTLVGCLAQKGIHSMGVDLNNEKNDLINRGISPIKEKEVSELISKYKGMIIATDDSKEAILNTEISFICIGTPSNNDGSVNTGHIFTFAKDAATGKRRFRLCYKNET